MKKKASQTRRTFCTAGIVPTDQFCLNTTFRSFSPSSFSSGGVIQLLTFLQKNIKYPDAAQVTQTEGRVLVSFVIEKDGSISNAEIVGSPSNYDIVESVSPILDAEVLRVVGLMDKWTPGKQDGKLVRVKYTLPIHFKIPTPPRNAVLVQYGMEDGKKVVTCTLTNMDKLTDDQKKAKIEMKDLDANIKKLGKKKAEGFFVLANDPETLNEFNTLGYSGISSQTVSSTTHHHSSGPF